MMFGDVGGMVDFILIVLSPILSYFTSSFMSASLVSKLYHVSESELKTTNTNSSPLEALLSIKQIPFSSVLAIIDACSCKVLRRNSRKLRA